jgi:MFS family permease
MTERDKKAPSQFFLAAVHLKLVALLVIGPMVILNMAKHFDLSVLEIKVWTTALLLGMGFAAFGAGALSEAFGRRLVGIIASIVLLAASLLTGLGWSYGLILALAPVLGVFVSIIDINMDGYIGSVTKGSKASGMFSHVQMYSDIAAAVFALVFGVLTISTEGSWRWFFFLFALLNLFTLLLITREYPSETAQPHAFREFIGNFKEGLKLLRIPAFLCIVGTATFGSSTLAAIITDGPTALGIQSNANGWVYGATFALVAFMGGVGYMAGMAISRRKQPSTQLIVGSTVMTAAGVWMILATAITPGNAILLGIPIAISFGGHTIVTGAALAAAVSIAQVKSNVGASMLTMFKRLIPLFLSGLLIVLTALKINTSPLSMSIAVFACGALALVCSTLSRRLTSKAIDVG